MQTVSQAWKDAQEQTLVPVSYVENQFEHRRSRRSGGCIKFCKWRNAVLGRNEPSHWS